MKWCLLSLLAASAAGSPLASSPSSTSAQNDKLDRNANHIFNAIHSSMRQWGSSLHHNGMSFFLAHLPAGTHFYHGTSHSQPVTGTEWLAFEPEHAMVFASRGFGGPPKNKPGPPGGQEPMQVVEEEEEEEEETENKGYLHTYAAAKDLRLLYIDGMSAAKTGLGTLDSQDHLLLNDELGRGNNGGRGGMGGGERERAVEMCRMAREDWVGRIDGILRMEAGFEIILCDFGRDLETVSISQVKRRERGSGGGPGGSGNFNSWMKAIADRYDSIGGHRVSLDFDHFVTAYSYPLDLFPDKSFPLPRLEHIPAAELDRVRADLDAMILTRSPSADNFDWQAVTDMIVKRYALELRFLASGNLTTLESLQGEVERVLSPFIDQSDSYENEFRRDTVTADRCARQFISSRAPQESYAAQAVYRVAHAVCATLVAVSREESYPAALGTLHRLIDWLAWSTWKQCNGCADNEICVVPIWPEGSLEDYQHPQCREALHPFVGGERYWGGGFHRRDEL
ncbi:hypothetical protein ASPZODRAFT_62150 [Penicilliopsis zonata CBS 506.65]|uniref:Uncharacterized protein n=1 Tax=Penicilliopsis zonata CBS 506.65 TaxID=1073090 RepID=A0A1L9SN69_9EURO|nr:hypothetical protein ASPZODRAFT_62150 [Penicilliopsis zonata CBS 506.65]OJJ48712.1 hypothetical protein ASPZODRAFT_62150 [Penicilliopsis zonata CBS 506.65]